MIHSNKDPQTATLTKFYEMNGEVGLVLLRFWVRIPKEFLGMWYANNATGRHGADAGFWGRR
jgi:hypothetical protein